MNTMHSLRRRLLMDAGRIPQDLVSLATCGLGCPRPVNPDSGQADYNSEDHKASVHDQAALE
jgi:hypothetical protein